MGSTPVAPPDGSPTTVPPPPCNDLSCIRRPVVARTRRCRERGTLLSRGGLLVVHAVPAGQIDHSPRPEKSGPRGVGQPVRYFRASSVASSTVRAKRGLCTPKLSSPSIRK